MYSFKSHAFHIIDKTADNRMRSGQFRTPASHSWSSQQSFRAVNQDFAPKNSSLWSGCSFPSQSVKPKSSSPTENLPDNFWKQPKPNHKDVDIFGEYLLFIKLFTI